MAKKALRKFWKKENKGFTLVELIIVIAIIAILVAILVPNYVRYVEKSRWNNDQNQMETLIGEVNTTITEIMEKGDDVIDSTGTNNKGTITITRKNGDNDTITISGFTNDFTATLAKTDSKLTTGKGVYLKNNGNHNGGTNKSSQYVVTVESDTDGNVKASGAWTDGGNG